MTHGHPGQKRCRWCGQRLVEVDIEPHFWHAGTGLRECDGRGEGHEAEPIPELHEATLLQQVKEFVGHHQHLRRSLREAHQARASAVRRLQDYQQLADAVIEAYTHSSLGLGGETGFGRLEQAIIDLRNYRSGP